MFYAVTDHVDRAHAATLSQFRDSPRLRAFVGALAAGVQSVEDELAPLVGRTISTATGAALEQFGDLVGEARGDLSDDDEYRLAIVGRVLANRGGGSAGDLAALVATVFGVAVGTVDHYDAAPLATVYTVSPAVAVSDALARRCARLVDEARPAGVRVDVVEAPIGSFRFDTVGVGFDAGTFARILRGV